MESSHASHITILDDGRPTRERYLHAGRTLSFGSCGAGCCDPDISTPGANGALASTTEFPALVSNTSLHTPLHVWNTQDLDQRFVIPPGQRHAALPFAASGISGAAGHILTIQVEPPETPTSTCKTASPQSLNPASRRYALLYYLATPMLNGRHHPAPRAEVAERLGVSLRAVDRDINRLIDALAIPTPPGRAPSGWKSTALVNTALARRLLIAMPTWRDTDRRAAEVLA